MTSRLCPACGVRLDAVITDPPPQGCGRDLHPCCDTGTWWDEQAYAAAERVLEGAVARS